ncbi:tyrosine-type recombinase/integrase [Lysobacter sp. HA35]
MKFRFTDATLAELTTAKPNEIHYDLGDVRGFAIRVTPSRERTFLLVYKSPVTGELRRLVLGKFGKAPNLSAAAARSVAAEKRALVDAGRDPYKEAKDRVATATAAKVRNRATLGALLAAYVSHLQLAGKPSHGEVAASVERNITKPHPKIAAMPVDAVTVDAVMPVFRTLTRAGKWRAAEKLAAHLRAAFNAAKASRLDAGVVSFADFDVRSNPLAELKVTRPDEGAHSRVTEPDDEGDTLTEAELRHYWQHIASLDTPHGAMMRLHLLSGAQRMEQLSRLTLRDWDRDVCALKLLDTKGRRKKARLHVVPLLPEAQQALEAMRTPSPAGPHLFTVSAGASPAVPHTLASAVREASASLRERELVSRSITPGTLRRTVETRLAAARVPKDIRGHLQSHGLGGLQDRHYDFYRYFNEKREALETLRAMLDDPTKTGKVVPLRKKG